MHGGNSGGNLNQPLTSSKHEAISEMRISMKNMELLIAIHDGKKEKEVKPLITEGADVNYVDSDGNTALHYAVIEKNEEVVNCLLENKADIKIQNNNNKTPFDICENEIIFRILGSKIVAESEEIIKNSGSEKNTLPNKEPKASSNTDSNELLDIESAKTINKIGYLLNCIEAFNNDNDSKMYKQAQTFILFLETFAFHNVPEKKEDFVKKELIKKFLPEDKLHSKIVDVRKFILKNTNCITHCNVVKIIESCYNTGNQKQESREERSHDLNQPIASSNIRIEKEPIRAANGIKQETVDLFFNKLMLYIKSETSDKKVSSFFERLPGTVKQNIMKKNAETQKSLITETSYDGLRDLVLKAYNKDQKFHQSWFDFVVNIYPALGLEDKKGDDISHMEKQIRHIRTNLIHEFYKFGIQEFREAIINLRGNLFEYYYAKKIYSELKSVTPGTDIEEIINKFNEDLSRLKNDFKVDEEECLSEKEAKNLFGYKFEKSIFPEQSANINVKDLTELVVDYFKYIPIVENVNRDDDKEDQDDDKEDQDDDKENQDDDKEDQDDDKEDQDDDKEDQGDDKETDSECNKKLDDVARRKLLEMFIRLRRIKECFPKKVYEKEVNITLRDITQYGVKKYKLDQIDIYFLKNDNKLNNGVSVIIDKVVNFIKSIIQIKESDSDYKNKGILFLGELFLNKDILDKELVFNENLNLKKELQKKEKNNNKITHVIDQVKSFGTVSMEIGSIIFKLDVRQTVRNMLGTFYNAYNKYRIEFDIERIFSRENFLNELVWQDIKERAKAQSSEQNAQGIISKLIDIEYMSPFIVKLIESGNASQIITKANLVNLIGNLLNKEEYVHYLKILLGLKVEKFNLYEKLYYKILEKNLDIKDIRSVFKEYKHFKGFAEVLIPKLSNKEQQKNIIELTKSFLKIINEEAADQLYYNGKNKTALEILEIGTEIQEEFKVKEVCYLDFVDTDLLTVRIKNRQKDYRNAMTILEKVKDKLEASEIKTDGSINYKPKLLLTLSDMVYTSRLSNKRKSVNLNYKGLYIQIIKYIIDLEDIYDEFNFAKTVEKKYNQVKNLGRYKNLLSSSELLHSEKYLDILKIAADSALQLIQSKDDTKDALGIYEDIYSCYKKDLGKYYRNAIQIFGYIADEYYRLSGIRQKGNLYSEYPSYYLGALIRYNTVYDARKKMFGPNHGAVIKIRDKIEKRLSEIIMRYRRS